MLKPQQTFETKAHNIFIEKTDKIALSANDNEIR